MDNNIVDLNVAPTANGAFSKSSVSKIGVATTNYTGYTLSISAQDKDNSTALVNGDKSLLSIENAITEDQFKALDSTAYNNMWGYLPSKYCSGNSNTSLACAANDSFLPSPTTDGDTLDITSTANTTVNEYEITLGARVDTTASLGSYSNVFIVEAVANAIPYTITYLDNTVSNMPTDVSDSTTDTTITVSNNTPQRNGYTFIGWCTVAPTHNANGTDTCPNHGTQVTAGGTIALSQTSSNNNFALHAMWSGNYTISGVTYMQDFATMSYDKRAKIVSSMVEETNYTLKDNRDNQDYTVAKLKDGNIWMTKNLNLAGGATLTYSNTDFDPGWTLPTGNGFQSGNKLPASSTAGFSSRTTAYVYNSNSVTCGSNSPCYSYYSWTAATLGSGLSITTNSTDAPYSICPKGWRLPTSRLSDIFDANLAKYSEYYNLIISYGAPTGAWEINNNSFYSNAGPETVPNFVLTGTYISSGLTLGGTHGYYWAPNGEVCADGSLCAGNMRFHRNNIALGNRSSRAQGMSVRCILK